MQIKRGRPRHPDVLTPREWEVLSLLREGLSNPEIAERLGISRDGAKYHVSEILTKLGLASREEAAVWRREEHRPWWAAAGAPLALLARRTAAAIGVGVFGAAVAGLALLAFLLLRDGGDGQPSRHELAYFSTDGSLWLHDADTDERRMLAQDATCGTFSLLEWSPTGERLACIGLDSREVFADGRIVVRDANGAVVGQIEEAGIADFYWSPAGDVFLYGVDLFVEPPSPGARRYRIADDTGRHLADLGSWDLTGVVWPARASYGLPLWSPDGGKIVYRRSLEDQLRIVSLDTGEETIVQGYAPLAWAFGGEALIVAAGYRESQESWDFGYPIYEYEANVLELGLMAAPSGPGTPVLAVAGAEDLTRTPALDGPFWLAPGGTQAVYLLGRSDGRAGLGVIDLRTGEATPIADSVITYGAEHIPSEWVTFSRDGEWVYWVAGDNAGYRARLDGSGLEKLIELDDFAFTFSPDHELVGYLQFTSDGVTDTYTLYVVLPDGSRRVIDDLSASGLGAITAPLVVAWRP